MTDYWSTAPKKEIANEISGKWSDYQQWLASSGLRSIIQSCYDAYYSFDDGAFELTKSMDGSSANIKVQHLKSLIQRAHSIVTQAKLAFIPKAINSDASSQITSDFAKGLLEYYGEEKDMTQVVSDMVELGIVCLDSYVYAPWDYNQGEVIRPGFFTGDQAFHVLTRFDVASHPTQAKSPYHIVRLVQNKYDLAAQYPKFKDKILASGSRDKNEYLRTPLEAENNDDDMVETYTLIHAKTLALPKGRHTVICNGEVLEDSALPYDQIPIVHFQPGKMQGTTIGDSPITSLISLQQGIDALYSSVVTNNLQYAKQNIWSPSAIQMEALSEGYNNIISAIEPKPIQLVASSPETYKLIETLQGQQQMLSGINDTARGAPQASLKSGNSLALMLSVAVQFADETQKIYAAKSGQLASIVISNLQQFAKEERLAYIGGSSKKSVVRTFTGEDLEGVKKIVCELSNPLTQNYAARYELIQQWQQFGVLRDPKKIIEFMRTGQVDSLTEDDFKDSMLIRLENEMMLEGELPTVMVTDTHPQHILEHKSIANDPQARQNPELMEALNQHLLDHIEQMKGMSPDLAMILGVPALPSQQVPQQSEPTTEQLPLPNDQVTGEEQSASLPNVPPNTPESYKQ